VPAVQREDWTMRAKCRGMEDALFPEASDQKRARLVCSGCPVRFECLAEARSVLLGKSSQQAAQPAPSGSQSLSDSSAPTRRSAARSVTSVGKD
jgi:hypothetical protein